MEASAAASTLSGCPVASSLVAAGTKKSITPLSTLSSCVRTLRAAVFITSAGGAAPINSALST